MRRHDIMLKVLHYTCTIYYLTFITTANTIERVVFYYLQFDINYELSCSKNDSTRE